MRRITATVLMFSLGVVVAPFIPFVLGYMGYKGDFDDPIGTIEHT